MKDFVWYLTYFFFTSMNIVMYALIVSTSFKYLSVKLRNSEYIIRITDYRKRERLIEQQGRRLQLVVAYAFASVILFVAYFLIMADFFADLQLLNTADASWLSYAFFVTANVSGFVLLNALNDTVKLFVDEESGMFEDGLYFTFKDIGKVASDGVLK